MARVLRRRLVDDQQEAVRSFLEYEQPRSRNTAKRNQLELAMASARDRSQSGEWEDAGTDVVVGLYAVCHALVHGIPPSELEEKGRFVAARRAARTCLDRSFGGDVTELVRFVRWSWVREKELAEWKRRQGEDPRRLRWTVQFSASLVDDYRAARRR